jgi:hypothetical protein
LDPTRTFSCINLTHLHQVLYFKTSSTKVSANPPADLRQLLNRLLWPPPDFLRIAFWSNLHRHVSLAVPTTYRVRGGKQHRYEIAPSLPPCMADWLQC